MPDPRPSAHDERPREAGAGATRQGAARAPLPTGGAQVIRSTDAAYRLIRPVTQGGTAVIHLAEREPAGGEVVIKIAREDVLKMRQIMAHLQREAALLGRLAHPHCVTLISSGTWRGLPFLVLEHVEGEPLARLCEGASLAPERAVTIARQVLSALEHAHSRGVLHQDLKADNIQVSRAGDGRDLATLLDFGAARATEVSRAPDGRRPLPLLPDPEANGLILGTPSVMAPEQIRLEAVDARADIYAAGILLYQLLVGRKPFAAADTQTLLRMQLFDAPVPPRRALGRARVSADLEAVVLRALRKDASARFDSCAAMASALAETPEGRGRWRKRAARSLGPLA